MIVPTIAYNPVVLILKNEKTGRWHTILFWECPPPSGNLGDASRWKSVGHHTKGFDTREESITSDEDGVMALCERQYKAKEGGEVYYDVVNDFPWDGEGSPASVMFFNLGVLTRFLSKKEIEIMAEKNRRKVLEPLSDCGLCSGSGTYCRGDIICECTMVCDCGEERPNNLEYCASCPARGCCSCDEVTWHCCEYDEADGENFCSDCGGE